MDFFSAMNVSASALTAERTRMNLISGNLANANTTRTPEGGPYKRLDPVFEPTIVGEDGVVGVKVSEIHQDESGGRQVYMPGHPDADQNGYVQYPDINVVEEMTNMIQATRSYEANTTTISTIKAMYNKALDIGR